jgi:hypothetical protein
MAKDLEQGDRQIDMNDGGNQPTPGGFPGRTEGTKMDIGIGRLIDVERFRDAIHIAVAPVVALESLAPGADIGISPGGKATTSADHIGIVDPFLKEWVMPGQRFYVFLYVGSITALRHHWEHPAFAAQSLVDDEAKGLEVLAAKARIEHYGSQLERSYEDMMNAGAAWITNGHHLSFGFDTPDCAYEGVEQFWNDYELVTGTEVHVEKKTLFFSCGC